MIVIKAINEEGTLKPERELTNEEKLTVTKMLSDGVNFTYYQGDEPIVEEQPIDDALMSSRAIKTVPVEKTVVIDDIEYKLVENKLSWWKRFLNKFK